MKRHSREGNRERTKLWKKESPALIYCFMSSFKHANFDKYEHYKLRKKCYEDQIN